MSGRYDRRAAYELLTTLELRFRDDKFRDITPDMYGVTWPFLLNEYVIPKLVETGRIDGAEAAGLELIRRHRRTRPADEDEETWADIHELLLGLYPVHVMGVANPRVYRGQAEDLPLAPTLFRRDPSAEELERRLDHMFAFVEVLTEHDGELRAGAESGDPNRFLELVAVAQHYGFPTHLLDFTADIRVASYFACSGAKPGGTGTIFILHLPEYEKLEGVEGSPYGAHVTASAPNPRIARQHGLFLAGHDALLFSDPRTDLLERYRFQHGEPLSPVGGFDRKTLLDTSAADPIAVLAKETGPAPRRPSAQLTASFERFRKHAHALAAARFSQMGEQEYARACLYALKPALKDDATWVDRVVAKMFAMLQVEVGQRADLRYWFKYARLARGAFEEYLSAKGSHEDRVAAGLRLYVNRCDQTERPIVDEIIGRHIQDLVKDLNGDD